MNEVRAILKKNNIKIDNEIEVTSTTSDPAWGNKMIKYVLGYL